METYAELQQKLKAAEKNEQDAIARFKNAPKETYALACELGAAISDKVEAQTKIDQFLDSEAQRLATQTDFNAIKSLYRARRYSIDSEWYTYYEECPIIEREPNYLVVISQDLDIPGICKGGRFRLVIEEFLADGCAYHRRYGDYFYVAPLSDRAPLPNSAVIGGSKKPEFGAMVLGTPHQ